MTKKTSAKKVSAKKKTTLKKVKKATSPQSTAKKAHSKQTGAKKTAAKQSGATKKTAAKKQTVKKVSAPKAGAARKTAGKAAVKKSGSKAAPQPTASKKAVSSKAASKKAAPSKAASKKATRSKTASTAAKGKGPKVRATKKRPGKDGKPSTKQTSSGLKATRVSRPGSGDKKATPIVFSLDDVEALVASRKTESEPGNAPAEHAPATAGKAVKKKAADVADQPTEKRKHAAASLADILGFNPAAKKKETQLDEAAIPAKWKKYYKLLVELRQHVREELDLHTADTLKHSSRDDSGDLSSYANHQADAGTDSFDRDFALSLVSSEQEALNEIEEAILRIKDGTYGVCEVTGQPISKARLTAVPFARYSVEGQAEYEKNKRRKTEATATGLFGDSSEAPKLSSDDDEE